MAHYSFRLIPAANSSFIGMLLKFHLDLQLFRFNQLGHIVLPFLKSSSILIFVYLNFKMSGTSAAFKFHLECLNEHLAMFHEEYFPSAD